MIRNFFSSVGVVMVLTLVACGATEDGKLGPTSTAENQESVAGGSGSNGMAGCPMGLMQDVSLNLNDLPMGISVDFTTSQAAKVEGLRVMVNHMAEMWSAGSGNGGGHGRGTGTGSGCGMGSEMGGMNGGNCNMSTMQGLFQGAAIQAVNIEAGARLTFTAGNSDRVDGLRTAVRGHFKDMLDGKCPMTK